MKLGKPKALNVTLSLLLTVGFAQVSLAAQAMPAAPEPQTGPTQTGPNPVPGMPSSAPRTATGITASLTLKEAEALAIKNNPQIAVGRLMTLASQQVTREVRSNLWPTATADITGVDAESGRRISAGGAKQSHHL